MAGNDTGGFAGDGGLAEVPPASMFISALANNTTTPWYTRLPRNLTEGGVARP